MDIFIWNKKLTFRSGSHSLFGKDFDINEYDMDPRSNQYMMATQTVSVFYVKYIRPSRSITQFKNTFWGHNDMAFMY